MGYLVLARKWRPQRFEDIVGQQAIAKTLANAIRLKRVGHAFLFTGPRGIGKTSTARILSKALNCEKGPTPEPCNECRFCTEITRGSSMDVLEIDGASNRGIDEIRDLRENIKYAPAAARFKIIIIDEVHMLTREAFNALLKTLEEPPAHAKFILATTEVHKVPVTIISRCQRFDFKRIDLAEIQTTLENICREEKVNIEKRTLEVVARMADGSMRDGLSLLDQIISFSGSDVKHEDIMQLLGRIDPMLIEDVFTALVEGDAAAALNRFGEYIDSGGSEMVFNRELMAFARDVMAAKVGGQTLAGVPDGLVKKVEIDQLERMFRVMLDLEGSFRSTEFPRMMMDVALIKMSRIRSLTPIETLMSRLDQYMKAAGVRGKPVANVPARRESLWTKTSPASRASERNSGSPQVAAPKTAHSPNDLLQRIIEAVPRRYKAIRAGLAFGSVIQRDKKNVTIGFRQEQAFQQSLLEDPSRAPIVQKAAESVLGSGVTVKFVVTNQIPPSPVEEDIARQKADADKRYRMALEQPVISKLVKEFNGHIREIHIKGEGSTEKESLE